VAFLHAFVQRFPAYKGRPFWISGESYGARPATALTAPASGCTAQNRFDVRWLRLHAVASRVCWTRDTACPRVAGGHYVPNLASALLNAQKKGTAPLLADGAPAINLQGFLVGNAWTDPAIDNEGKGLQLRLRAALASWAVRI
jgi:Serine carboxypeptidase